MPTSPPPAGGCSGRRRLAAGAAAQFRVEISGVGGTQLPIGVTRFRDEDKSGQSISGIVRADLERCGVFRVVDSAGEFDETSRPNFPEWRGRGADALASGSAARLADGRFDVRFKLWDVVKGQDLGGQAMAVVAADLRLAAHRIADAVYEKLTGDKGVFSTRIAYVTRVANRYTLRVTDADGEGGQVALNSTQPIISPAWAPDGKSLAYVSFESGKAVVWSQDVATGERRAIANFRGSNSAPAWSPDGQHAGGHAVARRRLADLPDGPQRQQRAPPDAKQRHRHRAGVHARRQARSISSATAAAARRSTAWARAAATRSA